MFKDLTDKIINAKSKIESKVKEFEGFKRPAIKIISQEIADRQIELIENEYEPQIQVHLEAIEVLKNIINEKTRAIILRFRNDERDFGLRKPL